MKEKLLQLMKSEGLTSSRLAEIHEIQPSGISHILSGRNKPGFDLLQKILRRFPRVNPDWLLLDSSQMYRPDSELPSNSNADTTSGSNLFQPITEGADSAVAETATNAATLQTSLQETDSNGKSGDSQRRISRIILVYDDHSFEALTPQKP